MLNIWLGGLDTWLNRHGGKLCFNYNNRLNSIRKDDSIMALPKGMNKYWNTHNGHEFELLSVYVPFEETDEWVRYRDILNDRTYTCRLEAFLTRFNPQPD